MNEALKVGWYKVNEVPVGLSVFLTKFIVALVTGPFPVGLPSPDTVANSKLGAVWPNNGKSEPIDNEIRIGSFLAIIFQ
ncbi:hypothetical protein [Chryseobacterium arthrosphaerae]|uniref:hypothetical protein n=1 Tax=Chryseobacterium arthrosphaerae TaxID=651561 RepID=UPI003D325143